MKKKKTNLAMLSAALFMSVSAASAQITETFGTLVSGTPTVAAYEGVNNFDVDALTYSAMSTGTDIRNTNPSNGYPGASGSANALLQAQEIFMIELVNTSACTTSDSLIFGVHKSTNASNGIDFLKVQYESAPGTWTDLTWTALPTGSGTSGSGATAKWYRRAIALPAGALSIQMRFRFYNTLVGTSSSNPQFRIDDIQFTCGEAFDCGQVETPVLTSDSDSIFCDGGNVTLTSTLVEDASYTFYQVINGVTTVVQGPGTDIDYVATGSGTYYVEQNFDGCISVSNLIWLHEYESPTLTLDFSPASPVAPSTVVTGTAELANAAIFFSEYVEGTEFNKYLEIYNPTATSVNLNDFDVLCFHNGAPMTGTPTFTINLSGSLASGATYVIANTSATAWGGTPDLSTASLQFNGDDALVLVNSVTGDVYDIFGSAGNDPGSQWRGSFGDSIRGTENRGYIRKSCIYKGINVNPGLPGTLGFPTLALEWDTTIVDDVTDLGLHTYGIDFSWSATNATFISGTTGSAVDFRVGQSGTSDVTVEVTGLCDFNNCDESGNEDVIVIEGTRMAVIENAGAASVNMTTYPNPFTSTVNIAVEIAAEGNVKIEVIDMFGKVVAVVANTHVTAGKHNFVFDGSALNNGTYTARVISGDKVQAIRLVKTK